MVGVRAAVGVVGGGGAPGELLLVISGPAAGWRGPGKRPALMASRTTTSRRGFAAAAPRPAVKPASSTTLAISMVESMCSSTGMSWIGAMPGALFQRSEEHTSELQSLMRISYAVFCLKKKKQQH